MAATETMRALARAREGDDTSRELLLQRLRPRLVLWCASRMSSDLRARVEPEDVVQETLLAVHRDLDRFDGAAGRAFYAWLFRIAENRIRDAVDHFAAEKRRPVEKRPPTWTTASQAAVRVETEGRVREAIERLPEDYREVVRLRRFEERDVKDVAERMDRSANAIRVLYCRALKALAAEIPDLG